MVSYLHRVWYCCFRIVCIVMAAVMPVLSDDTIASYYESTVRDDWNEQYAELSGRIAEARSLGKRAFSESSTMQSREALFDPADRTPTDVVLRRTDALLSDMETNHPSLDLRQYRARLLSLKSSVKMSGLAKQSASLSEKQERSLFMDACALRRGIALANPEIDFDSILFVGAVKPGGTYHMCDQYLGWNAKNGGGLFLLTGVRSGSPSVKNILADARVEQGDFAGRSLSTGAFLSPDLSYDGKTVLFAWTNEQDKCYHIFKVNIDGTGLVQLTGGTAPDNGLSNASHNDFDPCWLPNGRIAFISERRGGYGRCHPRNVPTYTLYSMKDDGSDIVCLSFHETNEWHPSVDNQGQIVYTRWDYLDRDDCIAHHLWLCNPDGCNPRASHGNYPLPVTTMEGASWSDGRASRPNGEWNIRSIPGSTKYIATAAGHHTHAFGQLVMIDINVRDDAKMAQITNITADRTRWSDTDGPWGTAWPLSESYYLCNYEKQIVLLDKFGNREVLYTSSGSARPIDPIPARSREVPLQLSTKTWQGERSGTSGHYRATLGVMNVYNSDLPLGMTSGIKAMRIIQVFPQFTPLINETRIGYASESLARMVLGTVPVEEDGSVYCEAPVGREIYFQLLDEQGRAVQSMRSGTYVHPGEQLTCLGCHEDKWSAPPSSGMPLAFMREPSKLEPEVGGLEPVNFYRLAKPVLDSRCAPCHQQRGKGPDMSYSSLKNHAFWWPGPGNPYVNGDIVTAKHGGSRTIPGLFGAISATLSSHLDPSHHDVALTDEEKRRIVVWLDCNSNELGAYTRVNDQRAGKLVWPKLDIDTANPSSVELDRPLPTTGVLREHLAEFIADDALILRPFARFDAATHSLSLGNLGHGEVRVRLYDPAGRVLCGYTLFGRTGNRAVVRNVPAVTAGMVIVHIATECGSFVQPLCTLR